MAFNISLFVHFYGMSYQDVMAMPMSAFSAMLRNIKRVNSFMGISRVVEARGEPLKVISEYVRTVDPDRPTPTGKIPYGAPGVMVMDDEMERKFEEIARKREEYKRKVAD